MELQNAVIVSGARTPVCGFGGAFRDFGADKLAGVAIKAAIGRAGAKGTDIDEVILGNGWSVNENCYTGRLAAREAGLPYDVPVLTIQRWCSSGLDTITQAYRQIETGDADIVVASGCENMSQTPFVLRGPVRWGGYRMQIQHAKLYDNLVEGLTCGLTGQHMGFTGGENIAKRFNIPRVDQDKFALLSHQRGVAAIDEGLFKEEIVPVTVPQPRGEPIIVDTDDGPRRDTTLERLSKLRPAFDPNGTVTAGNASSVNDGGSAVVVMSAKKAEKMGIKPWMRIVARAVVGLDPAIMGIGPVPATRKALAKANMTLDQMDIIEINEAFAAQVLYCIRELGLSIDRVNIHGSGISFGHPLADSGCKIAVSIMYAMKRINAHYALETMCVGGGQGAATIFENLLYDPSKPTIKGKPISIKIDYLG